MRLVRNRRQVKKQLTLTHVQTAQGDINKGEQAINKKTKTLCIFVCVFKVLNHVFSLPLPPF